VFWADGFGVVGATVGPAVPKIEVTIRVVGSRVSVWVEVTIWTSALVKVDIWMEGRRPRVW
jgi:hypothetical protein